MPTRSEPSLNKRDFEILTGEKIDIRPKIMPKLKMFDPITFPTEIACWSLNAAEIVTANSGEDVAIATIVNPITKSDKPNCLAIFEAESTTHEAPNQRPKIVTAKIKISIKIRNTRLF